MYFQVVYCHVNKTSQQYSALYITYSHVSDGKIRSLRDREVACSASDRQGSNFESCVWRTVSSQSSHHPQEVLLAQFSLYVHKGGLKPDSFHFYGKIRVVASNWCLIVRTQEDTPAALIVYPSLGRCHQHVAQCCENIQSSFRYTNSLFGLLLVS